MQPAIGIDWGTSSLRATLLDADGSVREERARPWGIRHLPQGGFERALSDICAGWPDCPVIASGMVGSRQGWHEVPYVDAPAGLEVLAEYATRFDAGGGRTLSIVPGVRDAVRLDVMRGEETEIMGALAMCPDLAITSQIVLPGTHSKWVNIREGRIAGFSTMMTGEIYALLTQHSILGAMIPAGMPSATDWPAFDNGVRTAHASGNAGVLTQIFSARTLALESRLERAAIPSYISGLLIGEEWRAMLASGWLASSAPTLVGDARQCTLYQRAATTFGLPQPAALSGTAAHGAWQVHLALATQRTGAADPSTQEPA
ncbi:MAG: 2-dehydro-3-deoxygalactonokinase [Rhodanobacteraceae bacterium]|nr:MAG: 2-dehydro-3-deoxygalactonokinase [Rhodanobacteraceae bacterium]